MEATIQILKALSDSTRLRLIRILITQDEFCVCALMDALLMPQYHISKHLGVLRHAGLVKQRRCGTWAYYSISPDLCEEHRNLLISACHAIADERIVTEDMERLKQHQPRNGKSECCTVDIQAVPFNITEPLKD